MSKQRDTLGASNASESTDIDLKSNGHEAIIEESSDLYLTLSNLSEEIDRFNDSKTQQEIPNIVDEFIKLFEAEITKYDSGNSQEKWYQKSDEDSFLLESIDRISKLTSTVGEIYSEEPESNSFVNRTTNVLQRAMSFLEDEFRTLLLEDSRSYDSDSNYDDRCVLQKPDSGVEDDDNDFSRYTPEVLSLLKRIATAMVSSGYEAECYQIYIILRRNAFENRLNKLGFEKISIEDVQKKQWESVEVEISKWIKVTKLCVSDYFSGERKLSDEIFSYNPSVSSTIFSNISRDVVLQLLNFAEAVAMTKRSSEKLFKFLDMYEALRDLIPLMDDLFSDESSHELKSEIFSARCGLGESAIGIFNDLENSIKSDTGKTPVPGGAVHPLTRFTLNYLKYASEYKETLEQIFKEHQRIEQSEVDSNDTTTTTSQTQTSSFSIQLMTVMDLLETNLEAKSKLYKDISLRNIFLMNNGQYIIQKIKGSVEIHNLLGDTWRRKRSLDLRQCHKNYQRETWNKVLVCLRFEGLQVNGKVVKSVLKERFKSFNMIFDEIHKTQSTWVVSDEQLQSELRVSISAIVIPAYRSFLGKFVQYLDGGRQSEKYVKYGAEDIENFIDELFEGNSASTVRRRT